MSLAFATTAACSADESDVGTGPGTLSDASTDEPRDQAAETSFGGSAGLADAAGSGGSNSGGAGGTLPDASSGGTTSCAGLDEAACKQQVKTQSCWAYYGSKVPGGKQEFVLCDKYCFGGPAESCSVDPSGQCYLFPGTCSPSGWTFVWDCNPDAAPSCMGAFDTPDASG